MARVSVLYGKLISEFLKQKKLTLRAAALDTGVSAAYWNDMANGRVPSEEVIQKICTVYPELDENALRDAAGLAPNWAELDISDAVALYLRHNNNLSAEGAKQVIEFVRETIELEKNRDNSE